LSPVPEAQPDHETQHDNEEDENLDEPGSKEAADEIARIAIEQAQQQAKDQALIGRVWASNDSGESVMRKLQGSAGAVLETFSVIFVLVSTMPVHIFAKKFKLWRHQPTETLPAFVDGMKFKATYQPCMTKS
jgi:hypothetical protein